MSRWRLMCSCPLGAIYMEERRVKKVLLWPSHAKSCGLFSSGARKYKRDRNTACAANKKIRRRAKELEVMQYKINRRISQQKKTHSYHTYWNYQTVQFSCSVVSDYLRLHELQRARPPWPSPTPRVHPNPCPLCW